uniref:Uncharacterized protein n=1 Tax=Cacopsylla melanoneura TaxID=428564 RepID=A0A8D8SV04_9HEMI
MQCGIFVGFFKRNRFKLNLFEARWLKKDKLKVGISRYIIYKYQLVNSRYYHLSSNARWTFCLYILCCVHVCGLWQLNVLLVTFPSEKCNLSIKSGFKFEGHRFHGES